MRFDCGETWDEKHTRLSNWHKKFLWLPRKIGSHNCRWLEFAEGYIIRLLVIIIGLGNTDENTLRVRV